MQITSKLVIAMSFYGKRKQSVPFIWQFDGMFWILIKRFKYKLKQRLFVTVWACFGEAFQILALTKKEWLAMKLVKIYKLLLGIKERAFTSWHWQSSHKYNP